MSPLTFLDGRAAVVQEVHSRRATPCREDVSIEDSAGRILADDIPADRDYPPFYRSVRDGFAVRSSDLPGRVQVIGEVRAGEMFTGVVQATEAVEIMTGAPIPEGADAVVMVEHCTRREDGTMETTHAVAAGSNIAPAACEARAGSVVLQRGSRIDYTSVAWLATTGHNRVSVYVRPRVAILATGDEIIGIGDTPAPHQIRNSNSYSLAAQVRRAGGEPVILPVARDDKKATARLIAQGLDADLLLLSGGVSAGKYDFVESALTDCGAHFFFDRVLIQPGQPLVFGIAGGKFFFGLPGNPASTMVTFELFARPVLEALSGMSPRPLVFLHARLKSEIRVKLGLKRFLPAILSGQYEDSQVELVPWQGSGDIAAISRSNCYIVTPSDREQITAGEWVAVLPR